VGRGQSRRDAGDAADSRLLREEFPHLRSRLPTLWTNSYFVATCGGATLEVIKRYVENQRKA
jgi:putative transposase